MTAYAEQILYDTVEGEKPLGLTGRFEATHLPFPLAGRLMRNLSAIVSVAVHAMCDVAEGGSHGCRVAPEPVSNDAKRLLSLALQQPAEESLSSPLVMARLDQDVDHVAVLIDGPPQILLLAIDSNEDFVQVPGFSQLTLAPLQFPNIVGTEFLTPQPNRLIRDDDSPLGEQILHISEAQAEAMVGPNRVTDDFGRETIARVPRSTALHHPSLSASRPS